MKEMTKEMLALAAKGNQYAIEDLYRLTYNSVYKTAKALIQDEDTVLDIVQDSYVKAFQSLDQLDSPENFRAWIKRIAANKAKDYLKKKKPILFSEMANEDGEEIDFRDENLDHLPEEVLDRKETTRLMDEILSSLSDDQRMAIGLHYYQEMSIKEIAELMGCSENTVKSRLNYGRKKVEAKVKELEKKGTKLYSLAPLPFLLWLFRMDAQAAEIPSAAVLESITAKCAAGSAASAGAASVGAKTAAHAGAKAATGAGAKALTTKIIAGVLAATVAGGGTMLALSSNDREGAKPTQQIVSTEISASAETVQPVKTAFTTEPQITIPETTVETGSAVAAEEAYQGITAEYQAVIGVDSAAFLNAPETYFNGDHMAIRYYHMYHAHSFHYAYYDIDRNGMDELLIGISFGQDVQTVDIYGFDGEQAVQLINEPTLGDRSRLSILTDGTLYLIGSSGAADTSHEYYRVDRCTLQEASPSSAGEDSNISWKAFDLSEMPVSGSSFDSILSDIQAALMISTEDYDSNKEYYDVLYGHLGEGVMWMLTHREIDIYTMGIWNTYQDIDGDGQEELCIGRGVAPSRVSSIVIYKQNGEAICGDALYAYTDPFYGREPMELNYLGG